jgi:GxxExxY protein
MAYQEKWRNETSGEVVDAALKVHTALGPGLLESAYELCLAHELTKRGRKVLRQVAVPIVYYGEKLDCGYRIDLLVDDEVIVEIKAVKSLLPIHHAQILSYIRLARKPLGLLLNFHEQRMKDGIVRKVDSSIRPCSK